jgi:hypothetical protein
MERFLLLVVSSRLPRKEEEEEEEHRTSGSSTADADADAARMWSCDRAKTTGLCVSSLSLSPMCICVRGWLRLFFVWPQKKRQMAKNTKKTE